MRLHRMIGGSVVCVLCGIGITASGVGGGGGRSSMTTTSLTDTAMVSDGVVATAHTDSNLQNAGGVAFAPNGPLWIADNNSNSNNPCCIRFFQFIKNQKENDHENN
jgi:hypothetical protein